MGRRKNALEENFKRTSTEWFNAVDKTMQKSCVEALNDAADDVVHHMQAVFNSGRIQSHTYRLHDSLSEYQKARVLNGRKGNGKRLVKAAIKSEVLTEPEIPAKPGARNPAMYGRYPVSYGRIIEFSKRINPNGDRSFFYEPWYRMRNNTEKVISERLFKVWSSMGA